MKFFPLLLLFLSPYLLAETQCEKLAKAADLLDTKKLFAISRQKLNDKLEIPVAVVNREMARNYAYNFPALKDYGFPTVSRANWERKVGNLEKSGLFGKFVGFETKLPNGSHAVVRLDWDPVKKGHYNIEMRVPAKDTGRMERVKVAVQFPCKGGDCTEAEVVEMANQIFGNTR